MSCPKYLLLEDLETIEKIDNNNKCIVFNSKYKKINGTYESFDAMKKFVDSFGKTKVDYKGDYFIFYYTLTGIYSDYIDSGLDDDWVELIAEFKMIEY